MPLFHHFLNRGLNSARVTPTERWVINWLLPGHSVGRSVNNSTTRIDIVKRLSKLNNQTKIDWTNTRIVLKAVKAVDMLPLVDTLKKHYRSLWMCITFILFRGVRTWFSVINLAYSSLFWDTGLQDGWLCTSNVEFDRESCGPVSWSHLV